MPQLREKGVQVLGVSVDSVPCNEAWSASLGGVAYPLASDFWPHGEVAKKYGVLRDDGRSERALILIDPQGQVDHIRVYPPEELPLPEIVLEWLKAPAGHP